MKVLLKPFVFALSWYCWLLGHVEYLIMTLFDDYEWWVNFWYPSYNQSMGWSCDLQEWIGGKDKPWPWGPSWARPEDEEVDS